MQTVRMPKVVPDLLETWSDKAERKEASRPWRPAKLGRVEFRMVSPELCARMASPELKGPLRAGDLRKPARKCHPLPS